MNAGTAILKVSKRVWEWLAKRWDTIVAPNEIKIEKRVDAFGKLVQMADNVSRSTQNDIKWKTSLYQDIGLTNKEIKERILNDIEKGTDPLSILKSLADRKSIIDVKDDSDDKENPPLLEDINGSH